ncbi:MAG: hypothetical protein WCF18_10895 [Chthoniobacteraceae bacterium]
MTALDWGDHPVTPGRLIYLLKQKFGDGWRTAYHRDVIRPRICETPPIHTADPSCELHVLTSAGDWLNLLWALKSFYLHSGRRYTLCVHDDGTLKEQARWAIRSAFPDARLITRDLADCRARKILADFPRSRDLRATNTLALKVFDFSAFLESDRMLIFDSDILFFSQPTALLDALEGSAQNTLNRDWRYGYTIAPEALAELDFAVPSLINSGLGLIHRESMRLDWIEAFLDLPGILGHPHQIEQTLIALCSAKFGFSMLPAEYDVHTGAIRDGVPCRHYAGPTRPRMYSEGMKTLFQRGFLNASSWSN